MATRANARRGAQGKAESNHPGLGFGTSSSIAETVVPVPISKAGLPAPIVFVKPTQPAPKIFNYSDSPDINEEESSTPVMNSDKTTVENTDPPVSKDFLELEKVEIKGKAEVQKTVEIEEKVELEKNADVDKKEIPNKPIMVDLCEADDQLIDQKGLVDADKKNTVPKKSIPVPKKIVPVPKPKVTKPKLLVSEEWSSCKLCFFAFGSAEEYNAHCAGMMHKQRMTKQATNDKIEKKKELIALANIQLKKETNVIKAVQKPFTSVTKWENPFKKDYLIKKSKPASSDSQELFCDLCSISCTGQTSFDMHVQGQKHQKNLKQDNIVPGYADIYDTGIPKRTKTTTRESSRVALLDQKLNDLKIPLIGLKFVVEIQKGDPKLEPRYFCELCDSKSDPRTIIPHLTGTKHRQKYMRTSYPEKYKQVVGNQQKKSAAALPLFETMVLNIEQIDGRTPLRVQVETSVSLSPSPLKRDGGPYGPESFKRSRMEDYPEFDRDMMLHDFFEHPNGFGHPMQREGFQTIDRFPIRDMPPRNMLISRDMIPRDIRSRDVLPRDMLLRDMLPRDMLPRDMLPRDMLPRDVLSRDMLPRDLPLRGDWREALERERPIMPFRLEPQTPRPFGTREVSSRDSNPIRMRESELFERVKSLGLQPFPPRPSHPEFMQPRQEAGNLLSSLSNLGRNEAIQVSKALQALLQLQSRR